MTDRASLRKPKLYFDTASNPSHVTFDDGKELRRNLPWMHYVEARWDYAEPETIKIEIGDWRVIVRGHNLASLFLAIEEHTLARIRAQPDLAADREHEPDTFAVEIRFTKVTTGPLGQKPPQQQLEFETG